MKITSYLIGNELLRVSRDGSRGTVNGTVQPFRYDDDGTTILVLETPTGPAHRKVRPVVLAPCVDLVVIPDLLHDVCSIAQGLPNAWVDKEGGCIFASTLVELAVLTWAVGRLFAQ